MQSRRRDYLFLRNSATSLMKKITLREKIALRNASADQLTPATCNKHRRVGRSVDLDRGICGREQVDNGRRSSTHDLFHFGDGAPDGRPTEQTHHAISSGYQDNLA